MEIDKRLVKIGLVSACILAACGQAFADSNITLKNTTGNSQQIYFEFSGTNKLGANTKKDLVNQGCVFTAGQGNPSTCNFNLPINGSKTLNILSTKSDAVSIAVSMGGQHWPQGPCPTTMAELHLNDSSDNDTLDVSLVNGQNFGVNISTGSTALINSVTSSLTKILQQKGVYPPGCDECALSVAPPTWPGCPATGQVGNHMPKKDCKAGTQYKPKVPCQVTNPSNSNYTVTFSTLSS